MYNIGVIPGDGTGPEVVAEGLKVLKAVSEKFGFECRLEQFDLGGNRRREARRDTAQIRRKLSPSTARVSASGNFRSRILAARIGCARSPEAGSSSLWRGATTSARSTTPISIWPRKP